MTENWIPAFAGMTENWIPAFAGMTKNWIPAFAGMTENWIPAFAGMTENWIPAFAGMTKNWIPAFAGTTNTSRKTKSRQIAIPVRLGPEPINQEIDQPPRLGRQRARVRIHRVYGDRRQRPIGQDAPEASAA